MGSVNREDSAKQALIEKLRLIIDAEVKKPCEVMDDALVAECADFLMELEEKDKLSDEEIRRRVKELPLSEQKAGRSGRKAAIVAACVAVTILIFGAVTAANHFDELSVLKEWSHRICEMFAGERIDVGDISIIKTDVITKYDSVEEMLANESRDMLYPAALPTSASITAVNVIADSAWQTLYYVADDSRIGVVVDFGQPLPSYVGQAGCSAERIGECDCYIISGDLGWQGVLHYGDDLYTVNAPSYEDLVFIINNLKEKQ